MISPSDAEWRTIPGYDKSYQVNQYGEARRVRPRHKTKMLKPIVVRRNIGRNVSPFTCISITDEHGKRTNVKMSRLVATAFMGAKKGEIVMHIDGMFMNNAVDNLRIMDNKTLGDLNGKRTQRIPVARISRDGTVIGTWRSIKEAARKCYITDTSIVKRCKKRMKEDEFALDGTTWRYADDIGTLEQECRMIRQASGKEPLEEWEWE